jgi:hypothetical protein
LVNDVTVKAAVRYVSAVMDLAIGMECFGGSEKLMPAINAFSVEKN